MPEPTLFLNQAGTSWPKPEPVRKAVADALVQDPALWGEAFASAHLAVAEWFGLSSTERLLLTPGGTSALSAAIGGLEWTPGDRVVTSAMEHEALAVPIRALAERGVRRTVIPRWRAQPFDLGALERTLRAGDVRLVAVTAVSNVTGERLPIEDIVDLAHEHDARCLVDAAQLVGWERLDLSGLDADLVAFAGHKALHGVWGIGGLYVAPDLATPGWCDVGSVDRAALAGLVAAVDWLAQPAQSGRLGRALALAERLVGWLDTYEAIILHGRGAPGWRLPTVAFTVQGTGPGTIARALEAHGVVASGGHQCAPETHVALGTSPDGVVRISFGAQHTEADLDRLLEALATVLGDLDRPG
ncbi:MAG: aminotransferase class V-fold PLP-dependent enzyme [Deltaproteobacteria bacterium]|nr:aminotransferase class V-fold PLP-dependent enzyme [Deltaproteobacteria bacterium]